MDYFLFREHCEPVGCTPHQGVPAGAGGGGGGGQEGANGAGEDERATVTRSSATHQGITGVFSNGRSCRFSIHLKGVGSAMPLGISTIFEGDGRPFALKGGRNDIVTFPMSSIRRACIVYTACKTGTFYMQLKTFKLFFCQIILFFACPFL